MFEYKLSPYLNMKNVLRKVMLKYPKFRKRFDQNLYFNRYKRSKKTEFVSLADPQETNICKFCCIQNYLFCIYKHFPQKQSLGYRSKYFLSFLQRVCASQGKWNGKHFISGEMYPTCSLQTYQLESCLKFQRFALIIQHYLKEYLTGDFTLKQKKTPVCHLLQFSGSSFCCVCYVKAQLNFFPCNSQEVLWMLCELLVAILWFFSFFFLQQ